jgi:inward rectifier potassium channel
MNDAAPQGPTSPSPPEEPQDLGFGAVVSHRSRLRLLNRDGTFNVERRGLSPWNSLSLYHALLTMSWASFLFVVSLSYVALNFLRSFFFSVETFSTIGYGHVVPVGLAANALVAVEALVGLLWLALATGIVFARFSRPQAKVVFSDVAIVAPHGEGKALMFRIANARSAQLLEVRAQVLFSRFEGPQEEKVRRYTPLSLERSSVVFFPLSWTIVHFIDEKSPLFGLTNEEIERDHGEILVLLSAVDEASTQTVHARTSYRADEIAWNARFENVFLPSEPGAPLTIDMEKLHMIQAVKDA